MARKNILMLVGDYVEDYEVMVPFQALVMVGHSVHAVCPGKKSGEVVRVRVTLFPTANLFLPGHRIRLDVSSSNFPKFDVNPNTGEPEGKALRKRVAMNTVFVDAARPSRVRKCSALPCCEAQRRWRPCMTGTPLLRYAPALVRASNSVKNPPCSQKSTTWSPMGARCWSPLG